MSRPGLTLLPELAAHIEDLDALGTVRQLTTRTTGRPLSDPRSEG